MFGRWGFLVSGKPALTISRFHLFRGLLEELLKLFSHSAVRLGKLLFPLFALALDLPENFFDDKVP